MPTELEELVKFLHHGNTQIRQIAAENLVGYSTEQPTLFKRNQLEPVKDLKLLVKDYPAIAKNALLILVNISEDAEVLQCLVEDDVFLESLLRRVTDRKEPNADLHSMLLANLAKSPHITTLLTLRRPTRSGEQETPSSSLAIDQLLDAFVQGPDGAASNPSANYDYLSYLFADVAKHEAGRAHFLAARAEEAAGGGGAAVVPLMKMMVFTEHGSTVRRRGVANAIKNVCFDVGAHGRLIAAQEEEEEEEEGGGGIGLLPYVLLPLMGPEEYGEEDTEGMLDECQLLPPEKERETQSDILVTHLESLLLLTTEKESRRRLREVKVYPIIRELHLRVEDEGVREGCDRLVQVLMRSEEGEGEEGEGEGEPRVQEVEDDEDEQVIEVL